MEDKYHYMSDLSDKLPVTLIPVSVPCQRDKDCQNMTSQAMWIMTEMTMTGATWYLRPTCATCIVESGHVPLEPNRCAYCQMPECICGEPDEQ
jgi:hypothetical protein